MAELKTPMLKKEAKFAATERILKEKNVEVWTGRSSDCP
jgi:hypothetical protein